MTEAALGAMSEAGVARLRWGLFARALVPTATKDWSIDLQEIADAERPPTTMQIAQRRGERREAVQQAIIAQARLRKTLHLDPDDEAEA